jgi:anti-anti-sigma factor
MAETRYRYLTSCIEQGVLVLTMIQPELQGEELSRAVGQELMAAADDAGLSKVVVDLAKVKFLTSLGLQALLHFRRHLRATGGQFLLCNLSASVSDVLFTTRLATASQLDVLPFRLAPDVPTAIRELTQPGGDLT